MTTFRGTPGADFFGGSRGADVAEGLAGDDILRGSAGRDTLDGGDGSDVIAADDGNDLVRPGRNAGFDVIKGGRGSDRFDFAGATLQPGGDFAFWRLDYDGMRGAVAIDLTATGGSVRKRATDGGGSDVIAGLDIDPAEGGLGFVGSGGNDRFVIRASVDFYVEITAGSGDDVIVNNGSGPVKLRYGGGEGAGVSVRVTRSDADGRMSGSVIDATGDRDSFSRVTEIEGTTSGDRFRGGAGADTFLPLEGDDTISGGAGFDTLRYDRSGCVGVRLDLARGVAFESWRRSPAQDRDGDFRDIVRGVESVRGSGGADTLRGADAGERLQGRAGDDIIAGRGGADTLTGGEGDDTITGGAERDFFLYDSGDGDDLLSDFAPGLDLVAIFSGAEAFAELDIADGPGGAVVGFADVTITMAGVAAGALDAGDFTFG